MAKWNIDEYSNLATKIQLNWMKEDMKILRKKGGGPDKNRKIGILQMKLTGLIKAGKFGSNEYINVLNKKGNEIYPGFLGDEDVYEITEKYDSQLNRISWLLEE